MEKDGSPLSDEKQTIQISLFTLLKDFLKSPTPEELHCVLAYIVTVGEEKQVCLNCFIFSSFDLLAVIFHLTSFHELSPTIHTFVSILVFSKKFSVFQSSSLSLDSLFSPPSIRWRGPWMCCTSC